MFSLDPAKTRIIRHGIEQEPVIVIDDFAQDPERLIEDAARLSYRPIGPYFPGVRAVVPPPVVVSIRNRLAGLINRTFGLSDDLNRIECYHSLVTTPPDRLHSLQRLPHFDGLGPQRIAILHHLGRAGRGGTAFFRHRRTGFETMTAERLPAYNWAVNMEIMKQGMPPARYISGDTPLYQRIAHHEALFNRVLVYRGNTLHSADIPDDVTLTDDPRTGRFSINTFIWLDPRAPAAI
jgi:hypothetical protein